MPNTEIKPDYSEMPEGATHWDCWFGRFYWLKSGTKWRYWNEELDVWDWCSKEGEPISPKVAKPDVERPLEQKEARKALFIKLAKSKDFGEIFDFLEDNKCDLSFLDDAL